MTTTGGPEHSVTEPVTTAPLEGDDIVVVPDAAPAGRRRRSRALLVGAVVLVLALAIGIAIAVTRDDGSSSVEAVAPSRPEPAVSQPKQTSVNRKPGAQKPPASIAPETPVSSPPIAVAPPPPPPPATEPPVTAPPVSPTSVLQWSATPASLTILAGTHATLTVRVVNPSDGTVTLPHPLSCAPTLRGPKGHVFGYAVCVEMAQLMAPHEELTQRYTIYATENAAADGMPLAPGNYTASVENLFDVKVKVSSAP